MAEETQSLEKCIDPNAQLIDVIGKDNADVINSEYVGAQKPMMAAEVFDGTQFWEGYRLVF